MNKNKPSPTIKVVKLCLLVAHIECIFIVRLIWSQLKELKFRGTSSSFTSQKIHYKGPPHTNIWCFKSIWQILTQKIHHLLYIWCFAPWASSCSLRKNLLIIVPTPSCGLLLCLLPKKLHSNLHPWVKSGYLLTKNHDFEFLNWTTWPSLQTQCHLGA